MFLQYSINEMDVYKYCIIISSQSLITNVIFKHKLQMRIKYVNKSWKGVYVRTFNVLLIYIILF